MAKNITRYYMWEEPIGIYPPRQLGASEGYATLAQATKVAENQRMLDTKYGGGTFGQNVWILKATTIKKWHREGKKKTTSLPRHEMSGIF